MMNVVGQEKVYCFTEGEFSILADACGIRSMLCFRGTCGNELRKLSQGEYAKTVYDLCKRKMLDREETELVLKKEIDEMIAQCRTSEWIICFYNSSEQGCSACIYLPSQNGTSDPETSFTLILPGSRKSEYIRISSHNGNEFEDIAESYLSDNDVIRIFDGITLQEKSVIRSSSEEDYSANGIKRYLKK